MYPPKLSDFPLPQAGRTDWPWAGRDHSVDQKMPDGSTWPRVTIVTPSYNQGIYLEQTIRSVLLQGYPNLEYIIIDGGSTDDSVDIIRKYEPWLAYWVSEPDNGQSDALNKGFERATGTILGWLNSDDYYLPGVIGERVICLEENPEASLLCGDCVPVNESGQPLGKLSSPDQLSPVSLLTGGNQIQQPSVLMRASAFKKSGRINRDLRYIMDYELWIRMGLVGELMYWPGNVACFRYHDYSKTVQDSYKFYLETIAWLENSEAVRVLLSEPVSEEIRRKYMIWTALEYVRAGRLDAATQQFRLALSASGWPFGGARQLARAILQYQPPDQQTWLEAVKVKRLGACLKPVGVKGSKLMRHIQSMLRLDRVLTQARNDGARSITRELVAGTVFDPQWLRDPRVLGLAARIILGDELAGTIIDAYKHCRHPVD